VEDLRVTLEHNRNVMYDMLGSIKGVTVAKPDGTFYCFADFRVYNSSSHRLSSFLIDKVQVLTVPGADFGVDGFLRLSYCGTAEEITEGVRRIRWALEADSPGELDIGGRKLVRDWSSAGA
jgi:aspartate aminotransferase